MKLVKIFVRDVLECFQMTFWKMETPPEELEPLTEEYLNMTDAQHEALSQENMLELQVEYNVTVFAKWFFLVLFISAAILALYFFCTNMILVGTLFLIDSVGLYMLFNNRRRMVEMKHSLICFFFLSQEELDKLSEMYKQG